MSVTAPQRSWPVSELPPRPPRAPRRWGRALLGLLVVTGAVTLVVANWRGGREGAVPVGTPVPFAAEPRTFPAPVEDDYALVVDVDGVPTPEFRELAEGVAAAIRDRDLAALSRYQLAGTEQPNLLAGLLELYGGQVVTPTRYTGTDFVELGGATVSYEVQCGGGVTIDPVLHFERYDGTYYFFPDPAAPGPRIAATGRTGDEALAERRYPVCP